MADPTRAAAAAPLPTASAPEFVATFAAILVTIALLLFVDVWLARIDREESRAHAANLYADGRELLARHDPHAAGEKFAAAAAIERTSIDYQVGYAEAMLAEGRTDEAREALNAVLDRSENDGAANLLMARVLTANGRNGEAKSYYHRAMYGRWSGDSTAARLRARFELIDLLGRTGSQPELLSEILPVEDAFPDSQEFQRKLGHLLVVAGSPRRAIELLKPFVSRSPNDGDAYAGMGEAALALGNFQTARADLAIGSRLLPGDTVVRNLLVLADTTLSLDPSQRGISARERDARGRALLARTSTIAERCARPHGSLADVLGDSARHLLGVALSEKRSGAGSDEETELASRLWATLSGCRPDGSLTERAVALILGKLGS